MPNEIIPMAPELWQHLLETLTIPISWIPVMQQGLLGFFLNSSSWWIAAGKFLFLLFPVLLLISGIWCTQLSIYTLPFRSQRVNFLSRMLLAWWDATRAVWLYWVGLCQVIVVVIGWGFTLARYAFRLIIEVGRQVLIRPFQMTGEMTKTYFQPGVPWIAFMMLLFWCMLEAMIFTYTLFPTISEVLADLVGVEAHRFTGLFLFLFLFLLILGSFACLQVLMDALKNRDYKFIVQMVMVELFVMFFEVMFLYRELVDAITPWIAQQTGEKFRMGIIFTLSLSTFTWVGIRGMTWFLFARFGTPPMLAFISREPMIQPEGMDVSKAVAPAERPNWWRAPIDDFKREIGWLHEKGNELLEYLSLPALHIMAAALNFGLILIASRPLFSLPFKSLKEVMEMRQSFTGVQLQSKKAMP